MSLNGHSLAHDVDELDERLRRVETHLANLEIEHKHAHEAVREMRVDLRDLRRLAERAIGAGVTLGAVWTVVTFVVALLMRR